MGWVLRLVETGIDGPARVIDVLDIRPLGGLGEIAKLGLTLAEAKQILARLQQAVVAVQADASKVGESPLRPQESCGPPCAHWMVISPARATGWLIMPNGTVPDCG